MLKKTLFTLFVSLAAMAYSVVSCAQELYAGGNAAVMDFSVDGVSDDASLAAVYGRFGAQFNEVLSGELRAGFGIDDDSLANAEVELENFFGAYMRAGVPVTGVFYPYAVVGYTRGKVEFSSVFGSASESESDVSFGIGADFNIGQTMRVNVEYMNYLDQDLAEIEGFSIGFAVSF